ncbi:hypothetical protein BG015_011471 [Linnemannia schmuckeri]|uniref:Arm-like repeat domain-containing protein n=1 Tax=Linnemannia schmuckeri TaxID=64567 RepID=A0A9P5VDY8_9FUNG|nr:hypothetical protein BG015_011471 [Linnemannia schmuckeri]
MSRSTTKEEEVKTMRNRTTAEQVMPAGLEVPQDFQGNLIVTPGNLGNYALPNLFQDGQFPRMSVFPRNATISSVRHRGSRKLDAPMEPSEQAFVNFILQDAMEQNRIRWLMARIVEEFVTEGLKTSTTISEVILLGSSLDRGCYHKLLDCLITEFENATLLDIGLLQGLSQLVQCARPDYLLPDDLVRVLTVLHTHLQDTHQQSVEYTYYLVLALSTLLDLMVEGKVRDLRRVVDQEPLLALLEGLSKSLDRNIAIGLLGVASVCKLDATGFSGGAGRIYDATVNALDVGSNMISGAQSILDSGSVSHRGQDEGIHRWILNIIRQVSALSEPAISGYTQRTLHDLEKEGGAVKHTGYRDVLTNPPNPLPLMARLPVPSSSILLARVLAIPDVEYDLHRLKVQRLEERDAQIREMKLYREFIVICDGYDESQLKTNLYLTNHLNQPGQWKAKLVVSCRSHYLDSNYQIRFQPLSATSTNRYDRTTATTVNDLFQKAVIAPFSTSQIEQYVEEHASRSPARLVKIPNLIDLVSNPFLLSLALEALPEVAAGFENDLSLIRITRVELFDGFVKRWLEVNHARLEESPLSASERVEFDLLVEDDLGHGLRFQKDLAEAIFREQSGIKIAGADLHEGQFDRANLEGADLSETNLGKTWLRQANLCKADLTGAQFGELPYLQLGDEVRRCGFSSDAKLLVVSVKGSRIYVYDAETWNRIASHSGRDAIAISPTNHELAKAKSDQDNAVELGDILTDDIRIVLTDHIGLIYCIVYSSDGGQLVTASTDATIRIWSTLSGTSKHILSDHTMAVTGVAFSPTGLHLASCSSDKMVRICDVQTGQSLKILEGHTDAAETVVYSPGGRQIVSGGADDTARLWDANIGELLHSLTDHLSTVYGVAYSPDGHRVASSSENGTVRVGTVTLANLSVHFLATLSTFPAWNIRPPLSLLPQEHGTGLYDSGKQDTIFSV